MSLPDVLYAAIAGLTVGYIPVALIALWAARVQPPIWALTLFAILTGVIAAVIVTYVLAVANALVGYPVPVDVARTALRLFLVPLAAFPYLFLWVLRTGRFRDGAS